MTRPADTLELRIGAGTPAEAIVAALVTAMGARAGIGVERLDELQMATELLLGGTGGREADVTIGVNGSTLVVTVRPIAPERLRARGALIEGLAGRVVVDGDTVELSVDA